MSGRQLARLLHGERPIGSDREAAHPPPNALFQDERLAPLGDPQCKARQSSASRTNTWPAEGKGVSSMTGFVTRRMVMRRSSNAGSAAHGFVGRR
jgi:hypothetical protein